MGLWIETAEAIKKSFTNPKDKPMTDLQTKLDKEINEFLRAVHEYRRKNPIDYDKVLVATITETLKEAREKIEAAPDAVAMDRQRAAYEQQKADLAPYKPTGGLGK